MTDRYDFETVSTERQPGRALALVAKRQAKEERKRQTLINAAQQTEAAIRNLQRAVLVLDHSIEAELESSWIQDPSHFAFPMSARALITRRDNLRATIAALSDRLPGPLKGNHSRPESERLQN